VSMEVLIVLHNAHMEKMQLRSNLDLISYFKCKVITQNPTLIYSDRWVLIYI